MNKKSWRKLSGFLCATITMAVLLSGCGGAEKKSAFEAAVESGSIKIGFANENPYAYQTEDGELTGISVEVAKAVLNNLGITKIEGVLTEFSALIPGLQANRFDMITAGMFITKERAQQVLFADPEYSTGEAIAVKAGNPKNLHSYEDIAADASVIAAIPDGVIEYDYLVACGVSEEQIIITSDLASAIAAIQAGRADVATATGPAVISAVNAANDPGIERVGDFTQPAIDGVSAVNYGASAFRKDSQDFVDAFNAELGRMKESGELLGILESFGFTENELPGNSTTQEILGE